MTAPYAVVVGIESYAAGSKWTLNGPHSDAARFTRWLRARGVEPSRIALFLSSDEEGKLDDVPIRRADETSVFSTLTTLQDCAANPFIFFWSGHGVAGTEDQRLLFLADARKGNYVNLDFTQFIGALRTVAYPGLARQIFFVDACANYVYDPAFIDALPRRSIAGKTRNPNIRQVASFAASAGQKARNDGERREGVFTRVILDRIDAIETVSALFDALPKATKEVAKEFAESGEPQAPVLFEVTDSAGSAIVIGTPPEAAPAYTPMSDDQRHELARHLLKSDALANPQKRRTIIGLLPEDIRVNVAHGGSPLSDVLNLLETCDAYEEGMSKLLAVLRKYAGSTSIPVKNAIQYYESLRGEAI